MQKINLRYFIFMSCFVFTAQKGLAKLSYPKPNQSVFLTENYQVKLKTEETGDTELVLYASHGDESTAIHFIPSDAGSILESVIEAKFKSKANYPVLMTLWRQGAHVKVLRVLEIQPKKIQLLKEWASEGDLDVEFEDTQIKVTSEDGQSEKYKP